MSRTRGKAGAARSGTGSARLARPAAAAAAAAGGTWGDRCDDVGHRCPGETRRTTKTSTSALAVFAGLVDGWRRAWSGGGDDGGGDDDDDGTGGGAGAGADADAGGADAGNAAAAAGDDASQGVRSSVLAERGAAFAC